MGGRRGERLGHVFSPTRKRVVVVSDGIDNILTAQAGQIGRARA